MSSSSVLGEAKSGNQRWKVETVNVRGRTIAILSRWLTVGGSQKNTFSVPATTLPGAIPPHFAVPYDTRWEEFHSFSDPTSAGRISSLSPLEARVCALSYVRSIQNVFAIVSNLRLLGCCCHQKTRSHHCKCELLVSHSTSLIFPNQKFFTHTFWGVN